MDTLLVGLILCFKFLLGKDFDVADVVLLGFPLMINMSSTVRQNDLTLYYNAADPHDTPSFSWSAYSIGWLEFGQEDKAKEIFQRHWNYIYEPFNVKRYLANL